MRSLLVSMLVNVGDVIMMTSALDLIKQNMPGIRLGVLARPEACGLLRGNPVLDDLIIYPYKSGAPFHALGDILRQIRAGNYGAFLSLDRRPRGAVLAFMAGIKTRLGPNILFAGARPKWWTRLLFTRQITMSEDECRGSLVEMFQLAARRALNITGRGRVTLPPVSPERAGWVRGLFAKARGPIIGLCVRTNDPGKTWPMNNFVDLMTKLYSDFRAFMYITGGPGDAEYVQALVENLGNVPILNLAGQTELMDIPALAAQSNVCITLDNGAAHLMAASGQPNIICILIATTPKILIDSMPQATFISFNPQNPASGNAVYEAARAMIG